MAKILLVQVMTRYKYFPLIKPPLGLMYLSSVLRKERHSIKIFDFRLKKDIENIMSDFKPDIIGLSVLTQDAHLMHEVAKRLRPIYPQCKIIVGGPHASGYYKEILEDKNIDYVVIGEGEETLCELIEKIESRQPCDEVEGIALRRDNKVILNNPRPLIFNLDGLPFPSWDLINIETYTKNPEYIGIRASSGNRMVVITSRGCPYRCIYCHNLFGKVCRTRSPENVLLEIEELYQKYKVREIEIWDDIFNIDLQRAKKIADLLRDSRMELKIRFPNGFRADRIDEEFLIKLKEAGTYQVNFGIETGSDRLQKMIKHNLDLEKAKEAISLASKLKFFTAGFFLSGFPTETREEILATIRFAKESKLCLAYFGIVNAFKDTELYKLIKQTDITKDLDYSQYSFERPSVSFCELSHNELIRLQQRAYIAFYLSINRIWRILKRLPKKAHKNIFKHALLLYQLIRE